MATGNKTAPTKANVKDFIDAVDHEGRRRDANTMRTILKRVTGGMKPVMWGPSIIGYGQYHYKYESGREGDMVLIGFSPRKGNLVIYLMDGINTYKDQLPKLGPHKKSKACLYIGDFKKVDLQVLEEILQASFDAMQIRKANGQDA